MTAVAPLQVPGDCNQDGVLELADAICLLGHFFRRDPVSLPCFTAAANLVLMDCNGDDSTERLIPRYEGGPRVVALSGVVLDLKKGTTLLPSPGTHSTLRLVVEGDEPQGKDGRSARIFFQDGHYSVDNKIAVQGNSVLPCNCNRADVTLRFLPDAAFRSSDSNVDGETDISDAIRTVLYRFQGGSEPPCLSAADSNDDGAIDISDAIHTLVDLFEPETAIPAPGPFVCGRDPTEDQINCLAYDLCPYARIPDTTSPATSVRRNSRPVTGLKQSLRRRPPW